LALHPIKIRNCFDFNIASMRAMTYTYDLRISLDHVRPAVWRRVLVPSTITLEVLHFIIQVTMGWENSHLHIFETLKGSFGPHDNEPVGDGDESDCALSDVISRPKQQISYEYDFGDGWRHTIMLIGVTDQSGEVPVCIGGARACPPDDCGGPHAYTSLIEIMSDRKRRSRKQQGDRIEWIQELLETGFDPNAFSTDEVNQKLSVGIDAMIEQMVKARFDDDDSDDDANLFENDPSFYDPINGPDEEWFGLTEDEQLHEVKLAHADEPFEDESAETMHCAIHAVVERQIAAGEPSVKAKIEEFLAAGVDRHEALHAIGWAISETIFDCVHDLKSHPNFSDRLSALTLESWQKCIENRE
jgi:hypothetical protein